MSTENHRGEVRSEGHSRQPGSTGMLKLAPRGGRIYTTDMGKNYISGRLFILLFSKSWYNSAYLQAQRPEAREDGFWFHRVGV